VRFLDVDAYLVHCQSVLENDRRPENHRINLGAQASKDEANLPVDRTKGRLSPGISGRFLD
jgi:hypothetical protein